MDTMHQFQQAFSDAKSAAASFDAQAISSSSDRLHALALGVLEAGATLEDAREVRRKMAWYRDMCHFLGATLEGVVERAMNPNPGYDATGETDPQARPVLKRTYG